MTSTYVFPREVEHGNVEYKRKLANDDKRILSLTTQLIWRLNEGNGHAIYMLGLNDNGTPYRLTNIEYAESMLSFSKMCKLCNATIISIQNITYCDHTIYKILISANNNIKNEHRILLLGKSSTNYLSLMVYDKVTHKIFNHEHEHISGISSLTIGYIGIDDKGHFNNITNCVNLYEIKEKSKILILFYILPCYKPYQNIIKHMNSALLCDEHYDLDMYESIQNYKIPIFTLFKDCINNKKVVNTVSGLTIITILSFTNDSWLLLVLNNNCTIKKNDKFYSFVNMFSCVPIITITDIRYCDKYINEVNENITFTITVHSVTDLKKYKRETFFKI